MRRARRTALAITVLTLGLGCGLPATSASAATSAGPDTPAIPAKATDFNGDTYRDLVVGATGVDGVRGSAYVVFGSRTGVRLDHHAFYRLSIPAEGSVSTSAVSTGADFDGDGYADLVLGDSGAGDGDGRVIVIPGDDAGGGETQVTYRAGQDGVPGHAGSDFGSELTTGDFNGDGHPDLAVGSLENGGSITVLYGSASGLTTAGAQILDESVDDENERGFFGGLAAGDLDRDGKDDLVTAGGLTGEIGPQQQTYVFRGRAGGLAATPDRTFTVAQHEGRFGPVAVGDVNGDAYADLVIGHPRDVCQGCESDGAPANGGNSGRIEVYYGSSDLLGTKPTVLDQGSAGVPGTNEKGDHFGASLSIRDVDHDGLGDVAVGVPDENLGSTVDAGSVVVLKGARKGLSGSGAKAYSQDTAGVPGVGERFDRFGTSVSLLDLNADGRAELIAGAPLENDGTGAVSVLRGTTSGVTGSGALTFGPAGLGDPQADTHFGGTLPT